MADPLRLLEVFLNHLGHRAEQAKSRAEFYQWLVPNLAALLQSRALLIVAQESHGQGWSILGRQESQELSGDDERRLAAQIVIQPRGGQHWSSLRFGEQVVLLSRHSLADQLTVCIAILPKRTASTGETHLLEDLCSEIGASILLFERARYQALLDQKLARTEAFVVSIQNVMTTFSLDQWGRYLVNDLANLLQFDRVSLFSSSGKLLSVSGVATVGRHSKFASAWLALVKIAARSGRTLDHTEVEQADCSHAARTIWEQSLMATDAKQALVVPLRGTNRRPLGVLVCESFQDSGRSWLEKRQLSQQILDSLIPFLEHSHRLLKVPGLRARLWLAENVWSRPIRVVTWLGLLGLLLGIAAWQLFWVTREFEIPARAELEPETRVTVFAETAGRVEAYLVLPDQQVSVGEPLVRLSSLELEQELTRNQGLLAEGLQSRSSLQVALTQANSSQDRVRISSELEQAKIRVEGYQEIERLLRDRLARLQVNSPIEGQAILQGFDRELMNRPVPAGEALLEIADTTGTWRLRTAIEERHVGYLTQRQKQTNEKLPVRFRLVTHPTEVFFGHLEKIEFYSRLESPAEGSPTGLVTAYIAIDRDALGDYLRLGTGAWVRIQCGEEPNWFLLTYELRDKIREWFFY